MGTLLIILCGLAAALLIIAVLVQPGKGELSATMGGIGSQFGSMMGMRKAADFLQKFTIGLAIAIFVLTLLVNKFFLSNTEVTRKPVTEGQETTAPAAMPMQQPAQQQQSQPAQEQQSQPAQQ